MAELGISILNRQSELKVNIDILTSSIKVLILVKELTTLLLFTIPLNLSLTHLNVHDTIQEVLVERTLELICTCTTSEIILQVHLIVLSRCRNVLENIDSASRILHISSVRTMLVAVQSIPVREVFLSNLTICEVYLRSSDCNRHIDSGHILVLSINALLHEANSCSQLVRSDTITTVIQQCLTCVFNIVLTCDTLHDASIILTEIPVDHIGLLILRVINSNLRIVNISQRICINHELTILILLEALSKFSVLQVNLILILKLLLGIAFATSKFSKDRLLNL